MASCKRSINFKVFQTTISLVGKFGKRKIFMATAISGQNFDDRRLIPFFAVFEDELLILR
jgi:hypothetical protein